VNELAPGAFVLEVKHSLNVDGAVANDTVPGHV
jgi:hypothetical protein